MPSDAAPAAEWSDFSDAQLIARVRDGDTAAYGGLFERHHAAAVGFARRYARNKSDAEDLASEGFANVLSALQTGSGPEVFFRAYLFASVARLASRLNMNDARQSVSDDMAQFDVADVDPVLAEFESKTVRTAFQSLPERWQSVLWYTEIERRKPAAVAPLLGLTANGVSALAVRAREGLRQAYLQQHISATDHGSECGQHVGLLGAHARGGLGSRAKAKIRRHLAGCSSCTAIYLQLMDIGAGMRGGAVVLVSGVAAAAAAGNLAAGNVAAGNLVTGGWLGIHAPWLHSQATWLHGTLSHGLAAVRDHALTVGTAVTAAASAGVVVVAAQGGGVLPSEPGHAPDAAPYSSQPPGAAPVWGLVTTAAATPTAGAHPTSPPTATAQATAGDASGTATPDGAASGSVATGSVGSGSVASGTATPTDTAESALPSVPGIVAPGTVPLPGQTTGVPVPLPDPPASPTSPGTGNQVPPDTGTAPAESGGQTVYAADVSISRGGGLLSGTDTIAVSLRDTGTGAVPDTNTAPGTDQMGGSVTVSISYTEDLLNLVQSIRAPGWTCTVLSGRELVCTTAARAGKLPDIAVSRVTVHGRPVLKVGVKGERVVGIGRGA